MRKLSCLPLLLILLLALTACGPREASAPTVPAPAPVPAAAPASTESETLPEEKTVLTAVVARHSGNTAQWWEAFAAAYEAANPGFALEVTCVSWHDINAVIQARIAEGDPPDLVNTDTFREYQDLLLPVQDWVSQQTYGKFYPQLHQRATSGGTVWGIPDHVTARALYYNRDLLEAAGVTVPATWRELVTACQMLRAYDYTLYPWGVDATTDEGYATFACYIWNNGSDFLDAGGNWTLDDRKNLEAVEFLASMVSQDLTNPDPTAQTRYECQALFGQGKIAMMIAPSSLPAYCASLGSTVRYGIAPLPANGSSPSVSTATGNFLLCFAKEDRTPQALAAITALADAFYEDETYAQWVQMEGFLPATTTASALLRQQDPDMAVWDRILGNLRFYPSHREEWGNVKDGAVNVLQNTLWRGNTWLLLDQFQKEISGG